MWRAREVPSPSTGSHASRYMWRCLLYGRGEAAPQILGHTGGGAPRSLRRAPMMRLRLDTKISARGTARVAISRDLSRRVVQVQPDGPRRDHTHRHPRSRPAERALRRDRTPLPAYARAQRQLRVRALGWPGRQTLVASRDTPRTRRSCPDLAVAAHHPCPRGPRTTPPARAHPIPCPAHFA